MRLINRKAVIAVAITLVLTAAGLFWISDGSNVSAQKGDAASRGETRGQTAREDQLAFALRLGTAADYTVFGAKGVRGSGASIEGKSGTGSDEASLGENGSGLKSRSDLNKALSMIKQLPCQDMEATLTGGTFEPGVYCAPSAALAGQMVLDARGNDGGRFVFLIDGAMKSADNFRMDLQDGAKSGNVYFVADSASLGAWNTMAGSVIARSSVDVGAGTTIKGRAISKEGEVILADGANLALAPGYIQICKYALHDGVARAFFGSDGAGYSPADAGTSNTDLDHTLPVLASLRSRIFQFSINGGAPIQVPVGSCSNPIQVNDATATVTELNTGFYTNLSQTPANTWTDRFRLVYVNARATQGQSAPNLTTDLRTRSTMFSVPDTASTNPVILDFTNTFAIPAVIEICKYPVQPTEVQDIILTAALAPAAEVINDTEVLGFFDFTVNVIQGRVFSIPVGFCSGPIFLDPVQNLTASTTPQPFDPANPASASVYVSEIGRAGFTLEATTVVGGNAENRAFTPLVRDRRIINGGTDESDNCAITTNWVPPICVVGNVGGGYIGGIVYENSTAADQTIFSFFNRTNPGIIKVCKIAGPGVPVGTRFTFDVRGRQATPGTILPGVDVIRQVTVAAGPAEQGGFCAIVTEGDSSNTRFIVGSLAYVQETGVLDDVAGVQPGGFGNVVSPDGDGPITDPASQVRVSRIQVNGSTANIPAGPQTVQGITVNPNPNLVSREVIFRVRRGETVVDFVNFLFRPTQLKLCKVASTPALIGQNFTFNITVDSVGGLIPVPAQAGNRPTAIAPITIPAGDPAQSSQGNCVIVDGPYERPGGQSPPLSFGTFNVGSIVIVTETPAPGTSITTVTSPTGTPVLDLPNGRASLTLGFPGGFNELVFTNGLGGGLESDIGERHTGDGLLLANDVVFLRLFAVGLLTPVISPNEFQRADAAPRASLGDGLVLSPDVVQARRYVAGLDPPTPAGGPLVPVAPVIVSPLAGLTSAGQRTISAFTTTGCAGFGTLVSIMLESDGLEAGAGFTVTFDKDVLKNPTILLGQDAANAGFVLTTNLNNVASGQIGILLDAQNAFPAGSPTRQLVNIHFQVISGTTASSTQIGFSNKTTYLSTSDALGNLLDTSYQPSNISIGGVSCNTSADVSVAGRVLSPQGNGIRSATVTFSDSTGKVRTVMTNSLGYYELSGVRAGQTYVIGVSSKRYRFTSRVLQVADSLADIDFVGAE